MKIINYSLNRGNQTYANENKKRKQRNLGTESCLAEQQKWELEGLVISSGEFRLNSCIKFTAKLIKISPL